MKFLKNKRSNKENSKDNPTRNKRINIIIGKITRTIVFIFLIVFIWEFMNVSFLWDIPLSGLSIKDILSVIVGIVLALYVIKRLFKKCDTECYEKLWSSIAYISLSLITLAIIGYILFIMIFS
jgi:hypothetical protein